MKKENKSYGSALSTQSSEFVLSFILTTVSAFIKEKKATSKLHVIKTIPNAMIPSYPKFVINLDSTGFGFRGGLVPLLPCCGTDERFDSRSPVPDP